MLVYVAAGFIAGAWCGALFGMLIWNEVVTHGVREDCELERDRLLSSRDAWKHMYQYAVEERVATSRAFALMIKDNEGHSRKVVPIRSAS